MARMKWWKGNSFESTFRLNFLNGFPYFFCWNALFIIKFQEKLGKRIGKKRKLFWLSKLDGFKIHFHVMLVHTGHIFKMTALGINADLVVALRFVLSWVYFTYKFFKKTQFMDIFKKKVPKIFFWLLLTYTQFFVLFLIKRRSSTSPFHPEMHIIIY